MPASLYEIVDLPVFQIVTDRVSEYEPFVGS